ncbi:protein of unknown function [Burkholderia multivorans]
MLLMSESTAQAFPRLADAPSRPISTYRGRGPHSTAFRGHIVKWNRDIPCLIDYGQRRVAQVSTRKATT